MTQEKNETWIHFIKFTLFSISAGLIQLLSFTICYDLIKMIYWPSYLIGLLLSILWNFTLNRKFTFKSAANIPIAMLKVGIFYAVFVPVSTYLGDYLVDDVGVYAYIVLGTTMVMNFVTEFLYTKYFVYKNQINTAISASS